MIRFSIFKSASSRLKAALCAVLIFALFIVSVNVYKQIECVSAAVGSLEKQNTVIIDAGHGGFDGGAVVNGISEKNINLKIACQLNLLLKSSGYNVIMTRTDDSSTDSEPEASISVRKRSDMRNRLSIAKNNPEAIFISIHLNKFESSGAKGAQMFYSPKNEASKYLAESLRKNIVSFLQPDNSRTLKIGTKSTYLLYNSPIPAVIAECGFMSNPEEFKRLQSTDYQHKMAFALFCGINEFYSQE